MRPDLRARAASGRAELGPAGLLPLGVLFVLNFVDEFDSYAFQTLAPEIRTAFSLSDSGFGVLVGLVGFGVTALAMPLGHLIDRAPRVRLAALAAATWAVLGAATAVVPTVLLLGVARFGAGLGRAVNVPLHTSLLADYYDDRVRPRVFAAWGLATSAGAVAAPVAGLLAVAVGWRATFLLMALPTAVAVVLTLRLTEPDRGQQADRRLAAVAAAAPPPSFGEARRQILAIPTLRRLLVAVFVLGFALYPLTTVLSFTFEQVFGLGAAGRGFALLTFGVGSACGLPIGAWLAARARRRRAGEGAGLPTAMAISFVAGAAGMLLVAAAPTVPVAVVGVWLMAVGSGSLTPSFLSLLAVISPPRTRGLTVSLTYLVAAGGGIFSFATLAVGERLGYRIALVGLAAVVLLGAAVTRSVEQLVPADVAAAAASLAVTARLEQAAEGAPRLLLCGLRAGYGPVRVLDGVDLMVGPGEVVALLGTNGAGKSTLLRAVSGAIDPAAGDVLLDGRDITHAGPEQTARAGVAVLDGGRTVFPSLTVREHLRAAAWGRQWDAEAEQAVLTRFPQLVPLLDRPGGVLSGGEQQLLGAAMALMSRPRLLLVDELSLGLAPLLVGQLLDAIRALRDAGTSVLLVEQSLNVARAVADRAVFLERGRIRFDGPLAELAGRGDLVRSVFLGTATVPAQQPAPGRAPGGWPVPAALLARHVSVAYRGTPAVDDVSVLVRRGETVGIIGPNGAGKSTLLDVLSGFVRPDAGAIRVLGHDVTRWRPDQRAALRVGRTVQGGQLSPSLLVRECLALAHDRTLWPRTHLGSLIALPEVVLAEQQLASRVDHLLRRFGLRAWADVHVGDLSTGTRRVLDLAMATAHEPELLLLDEPAAGLSQPEVEALLPLLRQLRDELGCSLVVVDHDVPLVTALVDRLLVMDHGRVIADGPPDQVLSDPDVLARYLGGDPAAVARSNPESRP